VLVLALESATEAAGVALADDDGVLATVTLERGRRHGENMAPAISFLCAHAGVTLSQLEAVCVDVGPGLFTGLRVGVASAKALGFALGVPLVEMTSLELLALEAARSPWAATAAAAAGAAGPAGGPAGGPVVVAVVDARRGQVFSARYALASGEAPLVQVGEDRLQDPGALAAEVAAEVEGGGRCLCVGDGARRYAGLLGDAGAEVSPSVVFPDVGVLAGCGRARAAAGLHKPALEVAARYLRPADVRINWERRMPSRPLPGS
jgi:tRNA threonylcarbamoyladenosine biosynthesis protein TsaB